VKGLSALLLALLAARVAAGTAYVSDELVLGVYAEQNNQGQRLATLHSGASVDTWGVNGEFTQVRLSDGITGWVKSAYLTTREPATVRVKQLQEELDRTRATTPALAEAAAHSEVLMLRRELAAKQSDLDAARGGTAASAGTSGAGTGTTRVAAPGAAAQGALAGMSAAAVPLWVWGVSILLALIVGFWLGYATLARRVRHKFGGLKVY
jgi:type II secretory pathway component PulM